MVCFVILLSSEFDLDTSTVSNIHQMIPGLCLEQLRPIEYLKQGLKNNSLCCVWKERETL